MAAPHSREIVNCSKSLRGGQTPGTGQLVSGDDNIPGPGPLISVWCDTMLHLTSRRWAPGTNVTNSSRSSITRHNGQSHHCLGESL